MSQDVLQLLEGYITDDPTKWGKLASTIQYRRLQLMLLREILLELRKLNAVHGGREDESRATLVHAA